LPCANPTVGEVLPTAETVRNDLGRLADQADLPLPELFRRVCEAAAESLRVERAGIWLFVNGDKVLRCVSLFERSKRKHAKGACLSLAECPAFLRAIAAELTQYSQALKRKGMTLPFLKLKLAHHEKI